MERSSGRGYTGLSPAGPGAIRPLLRTLLRSRAFRFLAGRNFCPNRRLALHVRLCRNCQCRLLGRRRPEASQGSPGDHQRGEQQAQRRGEERGPEGQRQQVLALPEPGQRQVEHDRQLLALHRRDDDPLGQFGAGAPGHAVIVHQVGLGDDHQPPAVGVQIQFLGIAGRHVGRLVEHRIEAAVVEIAGQHVALLVGGQRQHARGVE